MQQCSCLNPDQENWLYDAFHTNAPGSRHPKRWQDVEELLGAGIDVYTTVNVQHLERLNDIVGQLSGGKSPADIIAQVREMAQNNPGAATAALGGLAAAIFGTSTTSTADPCLPGSGAGGPVRIPIAFAGSERSAAGGSAGAGGQAPKVKVERSSSGGKVFRITEGIVVEGRIQKPNAFYVLQRSGIDYEWETLNQGFLPKILQATGQSPF